jgi:hypothetical protein
LPALLVSLLERRYLSALRPDGWTIRPSVKDDVAPLLHQVEALGRPGDTGTSGAMTHVLAACHEPGHALVMVMHGGDAPGIGFRHRLAIGARRLPGGRSTEDYLSGQAGALRAHFPGLETGPARPLGTQGSAAEFLRTAPALAALTGIPSGRDRQFPDATQGLDRLARSLGVQQYLIMVVAEPLAAEVLDYTLDVCRHLQGEVHAFVQQSVTRSKGGSRGETHVVESEERPDRHLPYYLQRLEGFFFNIGVRGSALALGLGGAALAGSLLSYAHRPPDNLPRPQVSTSENWSEQATLTLLDANARACEALLQSHVERLMRGRGGGWWRTAVYLAGESEAALAGLAQAVRSLCAGDATSLDPLRILDLPTPLLRDAMMHGRILTMRPVAGEGSPLGPAFDAAATCVTSEELSVLVNLPCDGIPGLPIRDPGIFAVTTPQPTGEAITLGRLCDGLGNDLGPVRVSARALNEHVLVVGTTGSGKTNTSMQLLLRAHIDLGRPFLVLNPAKAEYRRLAAVPELRNRLRVYSVGGGSGLPLRLNPFAPVKGVSLAGHIDLLKAVFNASFAMFAGMPQVLEQALVEVYEERGWSLQDGTNYALGPGASPDQEAALIPCLADLHDQIEVVLMKKGYAQEVHRNLGAALRSRIAGLTRSAKGATLGARRSTPLAHLFEEPAVVELQDLRDDEEKSFVMALLFMLLYQHAEVRQRHLPPEQRERLQHLTLIEEAHRLLAAPRSPASTETGDPRGKAVGMFTDMLAEMRALGEGFIIAEQIPTKLASETLKNTNLKVIHRLTAPSERLAAGQSIDLTNAQQRHLTSLPKGLAVVHGLAASDYDTIAEAVLMKVDLVKDALQDPSSLGPPKPPDRRLFQQHAGCHSCPSPCNFLHLAEARLRQRAPAPFFRRFLECVVSGDVERAWREWSAWRLRLEDEAPSTDDIAYCTAVQEAYHWLGTVLAARARQTGEPPRLRPRHRLLREELARALSPLLLEWSRRREPGGAEFREAHLRLADALVQHAEPPRLDACASCPARCRMLPHVAALDLTRVSQGLRSALGQSGQSIKVRWPFIAAVLQEAEREAVLPAAGIDAAVRWHWRYCLLANSDLESDLSKHRNELLGYCREPSPTLTL